MLGAFQSTVSAYQKRSTRDVNLLNLYLIQTYVYINSLWLGQELESPYPQNIALIYTVYNISAILGETSGGTSY